MNLPTSLRIGYRDYEVRTWPSKEANAQAAHGLCDPINAVIYVSVDREGFDRLDTLLHEVLHAVFDVGHIQPEDGEERIISRMASMLVQVMRDNPSLLDCVNDLCLDKPTDPAVGGSDVYEWWRNHAAPAAMYEADDSRPATPEEQNAMVLLIQSGALKPAGGSRQPGAPAAAAPRSAGIPKTDPFAVGPEIYEPVS